MSSFSLVGYISIFMHPRGYESSIVYNQPNWVHLKLAAYVPTIRRKIIKVCFDKLQAG